VDVECDTSSLPAALVTNRELPAVTLAGYCYAKRHGMKVEIVTLYGESHLQCCGITECGNIKSVYLPKEICLYIYEYDANT
jgi:hypothetical protein